MSANAGAMGFSLTMLIGLPWLRGMTPEGGSLEPDFRRLLEHRFEHMLGAHGGFKRGGARAAVEAAVAKMFAT